MLMCVRVHAPRKGASSYAIEGRRLISQSRLTKPMTYNNNVDDDEDDDDDKDDNDKTTTTTAAAAAATPTQQYEIDDVDDVDGERQ